MHLVSAVGSSWEKEKKKKDICSAGCNYFLAWSILVRIFLGAILHFAFLLFSLLACLSVPRGKTGERRRTHVPQALIITWLGASWNAFCIFAFCKQRGCPFLVYWSLWPRYTINHSWYKFTTYSCYLLADEYYEWSLAARCLRHAIEMKSSSRNSTAVHQSLLSLKKRPPIYLFYVAEISQNHVFFLGSGLRARGGFGKYNPRIFPHSSAAPLWVGRKNLLVAGS